ncbi:GNAT family N-acetyltransferase [Streptomyces sp. SID4919]|uniref:GNAT family N-acetyltransferase n=1 Tax=unclassified Streptomyces TaxID=2593676 RepID=UPI000823BA2F|nr:MULTISPECIES: GNAT family N-acetyltransferase [unclassified Streptomyces]MYY13993.1 GNAT family N-acetyltransferase [Streptomyces sp. SID4919]SCK32043.1 Protein N-acetyltransferase, RimJ/RimL family [Streptomyces sp. AmelKG-E11A]
MTVVLSSADLTLRPWEPGDADALAALADDEELRRWTSHRVAGPQDAARWIARQKAGWESGERLSFAILVTERVVGHIVLKRSGGGACGELGYWTGAPARGLGVAPRAVELLTAWAFDARTGAGLSRLQLIHNAGNPASCRVAQKTGYVLRSVLPPRAPHEAERHLHTRGRETVLTTIPGT